MIQNGSTEMKSQAEPLVSVVVPSYNAGPFLGLLIDSVLAQTCNAYGPSSMQLIY